MKPGSVAPAAIASPTIGNFGLLLWLAALPTLCAGVHANWCQVGAGTTYDHQQNFVFGPFRFASSVEMVSCFSHLMPGVFHQTRQSGQWTLQPVHPRFRGPVFYEGFEVWPGRWTCEPAGTDGPWLQKHFPPSGERFSAE